MANTKIRTTSLVLTPEGKKGTVVGLRTDLLKDEPKGSEETMKHFGQALPTFDEQYALVKVLRGRLRFFLVSELTLLRNWAQ